MGKIYIDYMILRLYQYIFSVLVQPVLFSIDKVVIYRDHRKYIKRVASKL